MIPLLSLVAAAAPDLDAVMAAVDGAHSGVVTITGPDGTAQVYQSGRTAPGIDAPMDAQTPIWSGSLSKQFAAAAVLSLVEQGTLSLETPVADVFSEIKALEKDGEHCTVARLLRATCGLPRSLGHPGAHAGMVENRKVARRFLKDVAAVELEFTPGSAHLYSNVGYDLAGLLVSRAGGVTVDEAIAPLLQRAGMTDTGTDPDALTDFDSRIAWGQFYLGGPAWSGYWLRLGPRWPTRVGAAGNVISTAADLERWTRALHGKQLLSEAVYAEMITPAHEDYAMGLVVDGEAGSRLIWHNGALSPHGYNTAVGWLEATETVIVVLNNQDLGLSGGNATSLMFRLKEALLGEEVKLERLTTTEDDRWQATVMGALFALLGPAMLLMTLGKLLWPPKHGRLAWVAGVMALASGAMMGMGLFTPLLPPVLGLVVIVLAAGMVRQLRRTAAQPLIAQSKRFSEWVSVAVSAGMVVFFALAPGAGVQVMWTAGALTLVAAVELLRKR